MNAKRLTFGLVASLVVGFTVSFCCLAAIVGDAVKIYIQDQSKEQIYREKLGIGNSDREVTSFLTKELGGLTHTEAMEKLSQWGDVDTRDCPSGKIYGSCTIFVSNFLGTQTSYEFTLFYQDSKVKSVRIYYS